MRYFLWKMNSIANCLLYSLSKRKDSVGILGGWNGLEFPMYFFGLCEPNITTPLVRYFWWFWRNTKFTVSANLTRDWQLMSNKYLCNFEIKCKRCVQMEMDEIICLFLLFCRVIAEWTNAPWGKFRYYVWCQKILPKFYNGHLWEHFFFSFWSVQNKILLVPNIWYQILISNANEIRPTWRYFNYCILGKSYWC